MFGLNPYSLAAKAGALLVALLIGFTSGWKVESWRWGASELAAVKAAEAERDALQARYTDASRAYEAERARTHVVYKTIYRQADAWVADHPTATCLDPSGVQLVNSAIAPAADSRRPDPAVPGSEPAR
jgi:hypothetical protein